MRREAIFILAVSMALWQSPSSGDEAEGAIGHTPPWVREVPIEAARSYYGPSTETKLRLGYEALLNRQWDKAEQLFQGILWETKDSEQVEVVNALMLRLQEERSQDAQELPDLSFLGLGELKETVALDESASRLAEAGRPLLNWLEFSLPVMIELSLERLNRMMEVVNERYLTRNFSEQELRRFLLTRFQSRFSQVSNLSAQIRPDGVVGAGTIRVGSSTYRVRSRIGLILAGDRPHAVIHEARVGTFEIPPPILKLLEWQVNDMIDQQRFPLRVKELRLRPQQVFLSLERA